MTTTIPRGRRPRGIHPKRGDSQQNSETKGFTLPEYLEPHEVNVLIAAANPQARLLILEQWRDVLRVSEALALQTRDLYLDTDRPTLRLCQGKGRRPKLKPRWDVHLSGDDDQLG